METIIFPTYLVYLINAFAGVMLLSVILFISRRGLQTCINLFTVHSLFLAFSILAIAIGMDEPHLFIGFFITLALKVILIPAALAWIIREIKIRREVQFYINTSVSLLIAAGLTVFSMYLIRSAAILALTPLGVALSFAVAMMLVGFFIIISRTQAITQMLGFLILENSLFLLITATAFRVPFFVEVGISFDVLIALLIMGIFIFKINQTFAHITVSQLREEKE